MKGNTEARPVNQTFFTPGTIFLAGIMAVGVVFAMWRYIAGLNPVTNLSHEFPWGIWKAINVAAIAAVGSSGFTLTAIVHIFHREKYHVLMRPGLVLAFLCYIFVGIALLLDLGKYYDLWHPMMPSMWQGNSALFEVAMCVMTYLMVLFIELAPIIFKRFIGKIHLPGVFKVFNGLLDNLFRLGDSVLARVMGVFMILGIVLCTLHQQTLGTIMVIAGPYKLHGLWFSSLLPVLFYLSAIAVGLTAAVAVSLWSSHAFGLKYEMDALTSFSRLIPIFSGIYIAVRIIDLALSGNLGLMCEGTIRSNLFLLEFFIGICVPFILILFERVRKSPRLLFFSSMLFIMGVTLNRINTYITGFMPPGMENFYFPSIAELAICAMQIAAIIFLYRLAAFIFPIMDQAPLPENYNNEESAVNRAVLQKV